MADERCDSCSGTLCPGDVLCGTCGVECDSDKTRGFKISREINRGDTVEIDYDLIDRNGVPLDLGAPGAKAWFTVKAYLSDPDQFAVTQRTLANGGITLRGATSSGLIRVVVSADATKNLPEGVAKLYYDLQVLDGSGRVTTVEKGLFLVSPDVTKATT